jgi:hypothetical protein
LPRVTESFRLTDVRRLDPGSGAGVTEGEGLSHSTEDEGASRIPWNLSSCEPLSVGTPQSRHGLSSLCQPPNSPSCGNLSTIPHPRPCGGDPVGERLRAERTSLFAGVSLSREGLRAAGSPPQGEDEGDHIGPRIPPASRPAHHTLQRSILSVILVSVLMICRPSASQGLPTLRHAGPDPASSHAKSFAWGDSFATSERFLSAHGHSPAGPRLGGRGDGAWGAARNKLPLSHIAAQNPRQVLTSRICGILFSQTHQGSAGARQAPLVILNNVTLVAPHFGYFDPQV